MNEIKKLYKIDDGRKVCGVCGGIGEYLKIDPTIIRIAWALLICCAGTGVLLYIICALLLPNKSDIYPDVM